MKVFIFMEKEGGRIAVYGSLKALYDEEKGVVRKSRQTLYNGFDFDQEDYEDDRCRILKRSVKRSKQTIFL